MMYKNSIQKNDLIQNIKLNYLFKETKYLYANFYPEASCKDIIKTFKLIKKVFNGQLTGYKACNTNYHNFDHTKQVYSATLRLLDGYNLVSPKIPEPTASNLLRSAILHDIGYIQEDWDNKGTGARFTSDHVARSIVFVNKNNHLFGFSVEDLLAIEKLIYATELNFDFLMIPFDNEFEKIAGSLLGTADILGQMSDRVYLEKLLFLYDEFREAKIFGYNTEYDIIRKTVGFYKFTRKRLTESLSGVFMYAANHFKERYSIDANIYMEAIEKNFIYLNKIIEDDTSNFRKKLRRGNWIEDLNNDNHISYPSAIEQKQINELPEDFF